MVLAIHPRRYLLRQILRSTSVRGSTPRRTTARRSVKGWGTAKLRSNLCLSPPPSNPAANPARPAGDQGVGNFKGNLMENYWRLQKRRTKRELKRRRQRRHYKGVNSTYPLFIQRQIAADRSMIKHAQLDLYDLLVKLQFTQQQPLTTSPSIKIPRIFSLSDNYEQSIETIKLLLCALAKNETQITIDFSECTNVDGNALFLTQLIRLELSKEWNRLNNKLHRLQCNPICKINKSKDRSVNLDLLMFGLLSTVELDANGLKPINSLGYLTGSKSQSHYDENKKGQIGTQIVAYLNGCLQHHGFQLKSLGRNQIDGLIAEILNNAEDHSPVNKYYVTANFCKEKDEAGRIIGRLNLEFLNFGFSIYEGFEETKELNNQTYEQMERQFNRINNSLLKKNCFSKEAIFTLLALQEGISRLHYEDESRGTGTMKFINSFFGIGDYEDVDKGYKPKLTILSGHTQLICDTKYRPFQKDQRFYLSLNAAKSLDSPPEKTHLKELTVNFPGTMLSVTIYLNRENLIAKMRSHD